MTRMDRLKTAAYAKFLALSTMLSPELQTNNLQVYDNSTEEILDGAQRGKRVRLFAGGRLASPLNGATRRLEENYLFDSRRFPTFNENETFPGAPLEAKEYSYFMNAIGGNASNNGFSPNTVGVMSEAETNMDTPGQVPQGKNFVMTQIGISFNTDISAADATTLLEVGALRYSKQGGQFVMHHGRPSFWGSGMGLPQSNTGNFVSNGNPDIRAVRRLAVPRVLGQRDQFRYTYLVPRVYRNTSGFQTSGESSTAITLSAPCLMTIWLWGGQEDTIPV